MIKKTWIVVLRWDYKIMCIIQIYYINKSTYNWYHSLGWRDSGNVRSKSGMTWPSPADVLTQWCPATTILFINGYLLGRSSREHFTVKIGLSPILSGSSGYNSSPLVKKNSNSGQYVFITWKFRWKSFIKILIREFFRITGSPITLMLSVKMYTLKKIYMGIPPNTGKWQNTLCITSFIWEDFLILQIYHSKIG